MITAGVYDENNGCICSAMAEHKLHLLVHRNYQSGDIIALTLEAGCFYQLSLDTGLGTSLVYAKEKTVQYPIPFGEARMPYPPGCFDGDYHMIELEKVEKESLHLLRDISTNSHDKRGGTSLYPHCTATVETREESVFAARNTIDGFTETAGHGFWPFTSWGDNEDETAKITIWFGRNVRVHKVALYLRADFPHDNYWKEATLICSDGTKQTLSLQKTGKPQYFALPEITCEWVMLCNLTKDELDPSPFPALTQWQVFGTEQSP